MARPRLRTREAMRSWIFDKALPFWAEHGVDVGNGGFVEQIDFNGRDAGLNFKRTRVAGRQVYVFSHAHMLGWRGGEKLIDHGFDWLTKRAWLGEDKGFARILSREGVVIDATPDLYDHAFILFAFAWRYRVLKDPESLQWLHRSYNFVEANLRHPSGQGYWNELPNRGWRQQNPHMHFTEACLAAFEATGDERFARGVRDLVALFQHRLFERETGTLAEYFTDDWQRAPGDDGRLVEPGHLMEWAWILGSAHKLIGLRTEHDIRAALRFAETHGVNTATGAVFDGVRDDGVPINPGSRSWPNAERIKGAIALYELDGFDPAPVIDTAADLLLTRYLSLVPQGVWMDQFDVDGNGTSKTVPSSTLYHLFLAFAEALRISE
jgi:mannose/cellobiose epimerase-like protein (N-acyl-D-glucosamine 2-epimerase family)